MPYVYVSMTDTARILGLGHARELFRRVFQDGSVIPNRNLVIPKQTRHQVLVIGPAGPQVPSVTVLVSL